MAYTCSNVTVKRLSVPLLVPVPLSVNAQKSSDRLDLHTLRRRRDNLMPFAHNAIIKMLEKAIICVARSSVPLFFCLLYLLLLLFCALFESWKVVWEDRTQAFSCVPLALAKGVKEGTVRR